MNQEIYKGKKKKIEKVSEIKSLLERKREDDYKHERESKASTRKDVNPTNFEVFRVTYNNRTTTPHQRWLRIRHNTNTAYILWCHSDTVPVVRKASVMKGVHGGHAGRKSRATEYMVFSLISAIGLGESGQMLLFL